MADIAVNRILDPINGILRPDWIKWAGIPENIFCLLQHEQEEERHGLLTKHYNSGYFWKAELFHAYFDQEYQLLVFEVVLSATANLSYFAAVFIFQVLRIGRLCRTDKDCERGAWDQQSHGTVTSSHMHTRNQVTQVTGECVSKLTF